MKRALPLLPAWIAGLAVAAVASLLAGRVPLSPAEVAHAFTGGPDLARLVVLELRLPRTVLAMVVGAALGLSGAVLQGLMRNPLAEPGLLGVSGGAALGAVIAIYFGLSAVFPLATPALGIAGAFLAAGLTFALGRGGGTIALILAGAAVSSLMGAGVALALNFAPSLFAIYEITVWLLGSLADRSWDHVALAAPFVVVGAALLASTGRALDALSLGEAQAHSLGVDLDRTRLVALAGTALAVGAATSVTGAIGFVGLVAPHLVRPSWPPSPAASCSLGSARRDPPAAGGRGRAQHPDQRGNPPGGADRPGRRALLLLAGAAPEADVAMRLEARDLVVRKAGRAILDGVSLGLEGGGLVAVVGPNGAGKSTLLRVLAGLEPPTGGTVELDGAPLTSLRLRDLARRRGYLPQGARAEWPLPVERLVALGLTPALPAFGGLPNTLQSRVDRALGAFDLKDRRGQAVTTLSGGELARAMLARALVGEPEVLIVDEPIAGLDLRHALDTVTRLRGLADEGRLVVAALHDLTLAARYATRTIVLDSGRVAADGAPLTVLTPALLRRVFGVEARFVGAPPLLDVDAR